MIAAVETPHRDHLHRHSDHQRGEEREHRAGDEAAGQRRERRGEIGADHVERAVRQIDQIHDAEDQRQAGCQQKQQHAQLHAVEALLDEIQHDSRFPARPRDACGKAKDGPAVPSAARRRSARLPSAERETGQPRARFTRGARSLSCCERAPRAPPTSVRRPMIISSGTCRRACPDRSRRWWRRS